MDTLQESAHWVRAVEGLPNAYLVRVFAAAAQEAQLPDYAALDEACKTKSTATLILKNVEVRVSCQAWGSQGEPGGRSCQQLCARLAA